LPFAHTNWICVFFSFPSRVRSFLYLLRVKMVVGMEFRMTALVAAMVLQTTCLQTCLATTSTSPAGISCSKHSGVNCGPCVWCAFIDVSMRQACVHARMHACVAYI
jgi:hypothetical protein